MSNKKIETYLSVIKGFAQNCSEYSNDAVVIDYQKRKEDDVLELKSISVLEAKLKSCQEDMDSLYSIMDQARLMDLDDDEDFF